MSSESSWNLTEDADILLSLINGFGNKSYTTESVILGTTESQFFNITKVKGNKTFLNLYDILIPFLGFLIIFLNSTVVISSGLILKSTAQPRTTYLLLGNIAMCDLVTGVSVIFGQYYPKEGRTMLVCSMQIGMIVSSTLASIWSVGLIAVDRFLYIIHGLQYQQWVYPSRVRLSIVATWVLGIVFGFLPAMGWVGISSGRICWYIVIAPPPLIVIISILGFLPIILVIFLYSIILYKALKQVMRLKKAVHGKSEEDNPNKIRIFRGKGNVNSTQGKPNKTSKWKAIKVVIFTTGSFVISWVPYFIATIVYVLCDKGEDGNGCKTLRLVIGSPLAILGFVNSLLNPIIYAWWHNGFREFIKKKCLVHFPVICKHKEPEAPQLAESSDKTKKSKSNSTQETPENESSQSYQLTHM